METIHAHGNVESFSSLHHFLAPLRPLLDDERVTEICINRPKEAFVHRYNGWTQERIDFATDSWCRNMANLVATKPRQERPARILLPLIKPVLISVGLFAFILYWTDVLGPLIYISRNEQNTISQGLANFTGGYERTTRRSWRHPACRSGRPSPCISPARNTSSRASCSPGSSPDHDGR